MNQIELLYLFVGCILAWHYALQSCKGILRFKYGVNVQYVIYFWEISIILRPQLPVSVWASENHLEATRYIIQQLKQKQLYLFTSCKNNGPIAILHLLCLLSLFLLSLPLVLLYPAISVAKFVFLFLVLPNGVNFEGELSQRPCYETAG